MISCIIISQYGEKCKLFHHYLIWCQGQLVTREEEEEGSKIETCFLAYAKVKGTDIIDIRNYWSIVRHGMILYGGSRIMYY